MRNKTVVTLVLKLVSAGLSLAMLMITSQLIGTEGRGYVSLFQTTVQIAVIIGGVVGGPALNLVLNPQSSKQLVSKTLLVCYGWSMVAAVLTLTFATLQGGLLTDRLPLLYLACVVSSALSVNVVYLLGNGRLLLHSYINIMVVGMTGLFFVGGALWLEPSANIFILGFTIANVACFAYTGLLILGFYSRGVSDQFTIIEMRKIFFNILGKGVIAQVNGLLLFFIFRVGFYIIGYSGDINSLGAYSTAILLCDSVWILAGALAIVTYSRALANEPDDTLINGIVRYLKISAIFSMLSMIVLNLLPASLYITVLGPDFAGLQSFILPISPGSVAASMLTILIHFYAAKGRYILCFKVLLGAFITSSVGCVFLIPSFGAPAAGVASSAGAVLSMLILLIIFLREHKIGLGKFFNVLELIKRYPR
jgi:O-antigen/teichoic acid export membrane protein